MDTKFTIVGAGGHAKVVIEIVEAMGGQILEVLDQHPDVTQLLNYPVTTAPAAAGTRGLIAIGSNAVRKKIAAEMPLPFGVAIHPSAIVSGRSGLGEGTVVMAGAVINTGVNIGKHCIINTNASVDHDCRLADFVHISPGAALAGNVMVGEGAHIGIGSSIIQGVTIGKWATIGAGAAIIEDVPDHAVVVGVPGKLIKYNHNS